LVEPAHHLLYNATTCATKIFSLSIESAKSG
jgi:hypothetical protein